MARPLRIEYPGAFYHITSRGNQRQKIFLDNVDFKNFINVIDKAFERFDFFIHCFVLMNNHYHFIIETPDGNLSKIMQFINKQYTCLFNYRYNKIGHIFQGRYKSILIDADNYILELSRYIHLNPARAGITKKLDNYEWSSLLYYACKRKLFKWLRIDFILSYWKVGKNKEGAVKKYLIFVNSKLENSKDIFQNVYAQSILGGEDFAKKVLKENFSKIQSSSISYVRKLKNQLNILDIIDIVSNHYGVDKNEILNCNKRNYIPRQVSLYFARKLCKETNNEIANYFTNIGYSGVSKALKRIDTKKSMDKTLDKELSELECKIMSKVNT